MLSDNILGLLCLVEGRVLLIYTKRFCLIITKKLGQTQRSGGKVAQDTFYLVRLWTQSNAKSQSVKLQSVNLSCKRFRVRYSSYQDFPSTIGIKSSDLRNTSSC